MENLEELIAPRSTEVVACIMKDISTEYIKEHRWSKTKQK